MDRKHNWNRAAWIMVAVAAMSAQARADDFPPKLETSAGTLRVERVAEFAHPWGAAFLPDGDMLVTRNTGSLHRVTSQGQVSAPIRGVPQVFSGGQGGLLDVVLSPDFAADRLVYLTWSDPQEAGASTAAGRGRLSEKGDRLENFKVIFRQQPVVPGGNHFGGRLAFAPDGNLFITTGDRFNRMEDAQNPRNHIGKVIRIRPDGSIPDGNPYAGGGGAPEIWSIGHRNVQGAAIQPETGELWTGEFGPRGGDEVNRPEAGGNYGWPLVSHGEHYSGRQIPDPASRPELQDAAFFWNPAVSPSGMTFLAGDGIPQWKGDLLLGGLSGQAIVRLDIDGSTVRGEERIDMGLRIRDLVEGPDGALYALTDGSDGMILRITAAR